MGLNRRFPSTSKIDEKNEIMAEMEKAGDFSSTLPSASEFDLDRPASQIASTFTDEVNNVGANAQSFVLDDIQQVAVTEVSHDPFVLDA